MGLKMEYKPNLVQYIFVPKKPRMSKGKIASQVSKVAFLVGTIKGHNSDFQKWKKENGMLTIVLQVKDQIQLNNVAKYLKQESIWFESYYDEGYTEVPAATMTAIATGILDKEKDGWRFARFRLYK